MSPKRGFHQVSELGMVIAEDLERFVCPEVLELCPGTCSAQVVSLLREAFVAILAPAPPMLPAICWLEKRWSLHHRGSRGRG